MTDDFSTNGDDLGEAGLFEAISHETRIRALFELRNNPLSFSELKRKLGISSSGNLQHHIRKLEPLIHLNSGGLYALTDEGQESLLAINAVRGMQNLMKNKLNMMTVIGTLAFYIVQMNIPFLFGNVTLLTPLTALLSTAIFGIVFYAMSKVMAENRLGKSNESLLKMNGGPGEI